MSCPQLGHLGLHSLVLLVGRDDPVGELLSHDVGDVVALLVALVQQLNTTATVDSPLSAVQSGAVVYWLRRRTRNSMAATSIPGRHAVK